MVEIIQCSRCVMDTTDPYISFDAEGVCNHCRNYNKLKLIVPMENEKGRLLLNEVVGRIKDDGRGKDYDCIIGLSGGVDSSYVAYLVKGLGLRPLAVHFDNGWNTQEANTNIENIVKILGIDLYNYKIDFDEFVDMQRSYLYASVVDIEALTDHAITALLYKMAHKHKVKYIISGSNIVTEGVMPLNWLYYKGDLKNIKSIHKKFGTRKLETFPQNSLFNELKTRFLLRVQTIKILNYVTYIKEDVKEILKRDLHWVDYGGKHYESIFTRFYQAYILPTKFGIDKRKPHLSSLINAGQMTREEALTELREELYTEEDLEKDKSFILKKLNLSEQEFNRIMEMPVVDHTYYASNKRIYDFLRKMKNLLGKI